MGLPSSYDEWAGNQNVAHSTVSKLYDEAFGIMGFGGPTSDRRWTSTFVKALAALGARASAGGPAIALVVPKGHVFDVELDVLDLPPNVHWAGGGRLVTNQTGTGNNGAFVTGARAQGVVLDGIEFESPNNTVTAVRILSSSDIEIRGCRFYETTILGANNNDILYAHVDTSANGNVCRDIRVIGNYATRVQTDASPHAAILPLYTVGGVIANNRIVGHHQGVQFWGGNANPGANGVRANERKCSDIAITGNVVTGSVEGGIWGSMGKRITITGNVVNGAGDVAIDFEGCTNCVASGNTVTGAQNHALTTFFQCDDIVFSGNTCTTTVMNGGMARVVNGSGMPDVRNVKFIGNTFDCLNGTGSVLIETSETVTFAGNDCRNVAIITRVNNQFHTIIRDNTLFFDRVAVTAFQAMDLGFNNIHGRLFVQRNIVTSTVPQPALSGAIHNDQFDDNNPALSIIEGNFIGPGFEYTIRNRWAGPGPGVNVAKALIRDNMFPVGSPPSFAESGVLPSIVEVEGNRYDDLTPWP
jgi:hypothetical protein